jgi:carboxymethylenebutenolidase
VGPTGGYVSIRTDDRLMPAYLCAPDHPPRGGVVVLHEVFGLTPHMESICQRLAGQGWAALAPALFHRNGAPVIDYSDPAPGIAQMNALTPDGILADLDATTGWFNGVGRSDGADRFNGAGPVGVLGFCLGGAIALYAATARDFGAAVTFYGVGLVKGQAGLPPLVDLAPRITCPWLGLYGALDRAAPPDQVAALREAASRAAVRTDVVSYENAGHAFHCDARPDRYHPVAAASAWRRAVDFLDRNLS